MKWRSFIISSVCLLQINKNMRNNFKIVCKKQYEESHRIWNTNGWKSISNNLNITDNHKNTNLITMWFYLCNLDGQNFKSLKLPATGRCQQIWKTQQWPQDWKRSVFIPIPKKSSAKECSNYCTIALISHASKAMLKILQGRLQQFVNHELPDVQAGFRKGRGTRDQIANIHWIMEKAREFQKNIYFCFIDYAKAFDLVDHNKLWKILKEMGIPDYLTCLLSNLHAGQEATVRTRHGTTDWFQIRKGVHQGCILSFCL